MGINIKRGSASGGETLLGTSVLSVAKAYIDIVLSAAIDRNNYRRGRFEVSIPFLSSGSVTPTRFFVEEDYTSANYISKTADNSVIISGALGTGIRAYVNGFIDFFLVEDGTYCPIIFGDSFTFGDASSIVGYDFAITKDSGHRITSVRKIRIDNNSDADLLPAGSFIKVWGVKA